MRSVVAAAVIALATPAVASAHPGVYEVTQNIAGAGCGFPDTACLTDRTQYAVANDGWALGFTESNQNPGGGLINYKRMPSSWRTPMTSEEKRTFAGAQTHLQAHATCATAALGDDPATWIPVVEQATGVDLTGMTPAQAQAACANLPGGTYRAADDPANIADALLASVTGPLQSQVSELRNQVGALQAGKAAAEAALVNRPLALTLSARTFALPVAMVTGLPGTPVTVRVRLGSADARRLKVSRTAASTTRTLGPAGAGLFTLTPSRKVAASRRALKVTIEAAAGGKTLTSKGTLR